MYLNVILTIFVIVQVVTIILIYKWWDKYGRNLFTSFTDLKKGFPSKTPNSVGFNDIGYPNPFQNIPDMKDMMKQFSDMTNKMGKFK
jgi:hypothetical protein